MPGHVIAPLAAQRLGLLSLGTFHQRRGDQSLLIGDGALLYSLPEPQGADVPYDGVRPPPIVWGRVFGADSDLSANATLSVAGYELAPAFDGTYWGLQAGSDIVGIEHENGHVDRFGLFYTHAETSGDISGNILGGLNLQAGSLDLSEDSIAGYWTRTTPSGWYVDTVVKYGWLNGASTSRRGIGANIEGTSFAASIETGRPFVISDGWAIEPQAQLIWQGIDFEDSRDRFSEIIHDRFDAWTGRVGARLERSLGAHLAHLGVNLWHGFSAEPTVTFNTTPLVIDTGGTWLEVNGGAAFQINDNLSAFGDVSYAFDVDGADHNAFGGQIGVKLRW
nr:autotransporter outer membrane beta-barrel domain-containing protein [Mesorhizobium sp. L-8-3]